MSDIVSSPPPLLRVPEPVAPDARDRLHQLAALLLRTHNAQLLREFLLLRSRLR